MVTRGNALEILYDYVITHERAYSDPSGNVLKIMTVESCTKFQ